MKNKSGITLVALVVTIIILLLLAGVTISTLSESGLFGKTKESVKISRIESLKEDINLEIMTKQATVTNKGNISKEELQEILEWYGKVTDLTNEEQFKLEVGQGETILERKSKFTKGLEDIELEFSYSYTKSTKKDYTEEKYLKVGDIVTYTPESKTFTWLNDYCNGASINNLTAILNNEDDNFKVTQWVVSKVEGDNIELMSAEQTTGKVFFDGAQGYNNAVLLLNDACSTLYSNEAKGITARSIKIEDVEERMTDEAKEAAYGRERKRNDEYVKYGEQIGSAYSQSNSYYPTIYKDENLSAINGKNPKLNGLGMSDQTSYIGKTDNGATNGKLKGSSIRPFLTFWYTSKDSIKTSFKKANDELTDGISENVNYQIIIPKETQIGYWVASRCVVTNGDYCRFSLYNVYSDGVGQYVLYDSYDGPHEISASLRPVVSLSSKLLKSAGEGQWEVID